MQYLYSETPLKLMTRMGGNHFYAQDIRYIYVQELYDQKCLLVYQNVYDSYYRANRSVYSSDV